MENPALFARARIQRPDGAFAAHSADDQRVFVNDARSVQPGTQIDGTVLAKAADDFARFWIERKKVSAHRGEQSALGAGVVLPINQPALPWRSFARALLGRVPFPQFFAGRSVQRD